MEKKLISSFTRGGGLLVFLILEAVCMVLVVTYNKEQREIYRNSKSILSDSMTNGFGEITQYWNLSAVNDSLAGELAKLRAEQDEAKFQNSIWRDSVGEQRGQLIQQYTYIAAKVVSNTTSLSNNFLTLNRGTEHGINTRMGVFDDNGIVGIVVASNRKYSRVMSILHRDSKISVEIKRNKAFGSLVWENTANPTKMELKYIPDHIKVIVGDTIQTNGFSTHFPQGRMVGTVTKTSDVKDGSGYHDIQVKLSNDLSQTRYVYIVNNLFKEAFREIEEGKENE